MEGYSLGNCRCIITRKFNEMGDWIWKWKTKQPHSNGSSTEKWMSHAISKKFL